jgi:hypothetical protein
MDITMKPGVTAMAHRLVIPAMPAGEDKIGMLLLNKASHLPVLKCEQQDAACHIFIALAAGWTEQPDHSCKNKRHSAGLLSLIKRNFPEKLQVLLLLIFILVAGLFSQDKTIIAEIKYISAELVYLNSGSSAGIAVGDTLDILHKSKRIGQVVVANVSEAAASCRIIRSTQPPAIGDLVQISKSLFQQTVTEENRTRVADSTVSKKKDREPKTGATRISGNVGIQWYQFLDQSDYHLNFQQPTFRIYFKARQLWNKPYNLFIRMRSRYNRRENTFKNDIAQKEWRNRVYEFCFSYDNPEAQLNYRIGRLISSTYSGVGYIDGLQLQHNINRKLRWGVFAGAQPQWQYADIRTDIQKCGLFTNYISGEYSGSRLENTLAIVGEYHGSTVSREFMYLQNSYYSGNRWNIFQSAEIDLNRGWRKDKSGQTLSLTGFYISGYYAISSRFSLSMNYDNRKNYFTYELRSIADSLFDAAFRQGLRAAFNMHAFKNTRVSLNFGMRDRENDSQYSYSYGLNLIHNNLLLKGLTLNMRLSGFHNLYTIGYNPSLLLSKYFRGGHSITTGYGNYFYTLDRANTNRINHWARMSSQLELPLRMYLSGQYEYNWGDDRMGHLILAELGYRL